MDGAEQNRSLDDCWCVFAHMWVCVYVTSFPPSPQPIPWTQSSGKGWSGGLFVSLYICVGEGSVGTYRELQAAITLATVYKYFHIYNSFFSSCREEVVSPVYGPLLPPHWVTSLSCIAIALPTNLPVHQISSFGSLMVRQGLIHISLVSVLID